MLLSQNFFFVDDFSKQKKDKERVTRGVWAMAKHREI